MNTLPQRSLPGLRVASFGMLLMLAPIGLGVRAWSQQLDASPATGSRVSVEKKPEEKPSEKPEEKPLEYWIGQLGHDHYLRREMASKKVVEAGPQAVELLADAIRSGDLEVVERSAKALVEIASSNPPQQDGGAYDRLERLSAQSVGRPASIARGALREIRGHRNAQARQELATAGITIGYKPFVIGAIEQPRVLVQIDEQWNGDTEVLQWLAWLEGIDTARVSGPAVTPTVMKRVAQVPGLRSLAIVDGTVEDAALEPLTKIDRIDNLDLRYARLTNAQGDLVAKIPLRVSLTLMGTGITADKVEEMRAALPGLQIDHRMGGFLGVTCTNGFAECRIEKVVPGGAAEAAGLISQDVIVQINDTEINTFKDLQETINQHLPGDEVEVHFRRGGKVESTKVRLRRLEET